MRTDLLSPESKKSRTKKLSPKYNQLFVVSTKQRLHPRIKGSIKKTYDSIVKLIASNVEQQVIPSLSQTYLAMAGRFAEGVQDYETALYCYENTTRNWQSQFLSWYTNKISSSELIASADVESWPYFLTMLPKAVRPLWFFSVWDKAMDENKPYAAMRMSVTMKDYDRLAEATAKWLADQGNTKPDKSVLYVAKLTAAILQKRHYPEAKNLIPLVLDWIPKNKPGSKGYFLQTVGRRQEAYEHYLGAKCFTAALRLEKKTPHQKSRAARGFIQQKYYEHFHKTFSLRDIPDDYFHESEGFSYLKIFEFAKKHQIEEDFFNLFFHDARWQELFRELSRTNREPVTQKTLHKTIYNIDFAQQMHTFAEEVGNVIIADNSYISVDPELTLLSAGVHQFSKPIANEIAGSNEQLVAFISALKKYRASIEDAIPLESIDQPVIMLHHYYDTLFNHLFLNGTEKLFQQALEIEKNNYVQLLNTLRADRRYLLAWTIGNRGRYTLDDTLSKNRFKRKVSRYTKPSECVLSIEDFSATLCFGSQKKNDSLLDHPF